MGNQAMNLRQVKITDPFWKEEMELVRKEVIPYQWEALNDRVPGAAPSFAMHNFRAAAKLRERSHEEGFRPPVFTEADFEVLPEDPANPDPDHFYGFLFQDSDFYKWVEAVAYSLTNVPDPALEETADAAIDLVRRAQAEDGYLDTYYILNGRNAEFTNLRDNHELYCFGHLTEAAVAYYEATGKRELLEVAMKYAAYIDAHIGPEEGKKRGYPGHEIAEMALVRLYQATGEEKYLELGRYFVDERGQRPNYFDAEGHALRSWQEDVDPNSYYQAHRPVREQDEALGHAVRAMYLYSGMTDVARLTGDETLAEACRKLWHSVTREKMYITGGVGSTHVGEAFTHPFDLPNDTVYAESCASIGLIFFARRMLQMEPKSTYADVMEKALYNTVLSGMALDGKSFFYVNPLEVHPLSDHRDPGKRHVETVRQKWFGCACCPPNIARLLSSVGSYVYTEDETTLFTHLYMGSEVTKDVHGVPVRLSTTVDRSDALKWVVRIEVETEADDFVLALRMPAWSDVPVLEAVGDTDERFREKDGYLYILGPWGKETLTLTLPLRPRFMKADSRVREDAGKVALVYGPTVYCLEEVDNGPDLHLISVNPEEFLKEMQFSEMMIAGKRALSIQGPGFREEPVTEAGLYYDACEVSRKKTPVTLTWIPYYMWANRGENEMQVFERETC